MRIVSQFLNNVPVSSIGPCDVGVMANPIYIQPWFGATEDYSIVVNGGAGITATYTSGQMDKLLIVLVDYMLEDYTVVISYMPLMAVH